MEIINAISEEVLFCKVTHANSFFLRFKGLLFKKSLDENEALFFSKTNSVHTMFMRFPIDVIYLDADFSVLKVIHNLQPFRASVNLKASHLIEVQAGVCLKRGIYEQQILKV